MVRFAVCIWRDAIERFKSLLVKSSQTQFKARAQQRLVARCLPLLVRFVAAQQPHHEVGVLARPQELSSHGVELRPRSRVALIRFQNGPQVRRGAAGAADHAECLRAPEERLDVRGRAERDGSAGAAYGVFPCAQLNVSKRGVGIARDFDVFGAVLA